MKGRLKKAVIAGSTGTLPTVDLGTSKTVKPAARQNYCGCGAPISQNRSACLKCLANDIEEITQPK